MDALGALGGAARGAVEAHELGLKESQIKRDNAIKDYQIKELAKKEADDNQWVPVSMVMPNYKEMPETFNALKTSMQASGLGEGFRDEGGIPMFRKREAKELMVMTNLNADLRTKFHNGMKADMQSQYLSLEREVESGMDSEGKAFKPDVLEAKKKKLMGVGKALAGLNTVENAWQLQKQQQKEMLDQSEKKMIGVAKGVGPIFQDKQGNLFTSGGKPYAGDPDAVIPTGVEVRGTPTQSASSVTVNTPDRSDHRSTEEKNYERAQKDPKFKEFLEWDSRRKKQAEESPIGVRPKITN